MINKKALSVFLVLTFGLTIILTIVAKMLGFTLVGKPAMMSQMVIFVAMFIPALSAIITQKLVVKKSLKELGFKWGPLSMYAKAYAIIILMFVVNYLITWLFFLKPDFTLASFMNQYGVTSGLPLPASTMILLLSLVTFIMAPIFNMIPSLGEEIGWRGFLLPNLEELGQTRAMIYSGMIWALWHTPMILILGFGYGLEAPLGALLHFITVASLGIWMGYVWFKTRSTVLAGFMHAVFNANAYGIWTIIFVSESKLIVGAVGVIGAAICLLVGLIAICKSQTKQTIR